MSTPTRPAPPGFFRTVRILLGAARRRAEGRQAYQRKLFNQKAGEGSFNVGCFGTLMTIILAFAIHGTAVAVVSGAVEAGQRIEAERVGRIAVDDWFLWKVDQVERSGATGPARAKALEDFIASEAAKRAERYGGSAKAEAKRLGDAVDAFGAAGFVDREKTKIGLASGAVTGLPALFGSLALLVWSVALVMQGEGLEADTQRRRYPMWEWLFSHPVRPGAVFLAEMLAPIVANPMYWSAPLFPAVLYGFVYGPGLGALAALLVGVPVAVAAACLGKGLEALVMLRTRPRSRGAIIGLMSWAGFFGGMSLFGAAATIQPIVSFAAKPLAPLAELSWPWLAVFLGQTAHGNSYLAGVLACWAGAGAIIIGSVWLSVWAADAGLTGSIGAGDTRPTRARDGRSRFAANPLYRKELTWFARDRSAIVQAVLVPFSLAAFQLFNFRGLLAEARNDWTYVAGGAIIFGTYFLWTLGPKSLASEGATLWIALSWPVSLENLLKAKAKLWALIASVVVGLALGYAGWLYPASLPAIGLVFVGWLVFARSMAEKAVTLATVTSDSGERKGQSAGRQWAVMLGALSFATGVITRQWPLALVGIIYSWVTAAAMWQNFRARLPFLLDPWSETLPQPPTLMHAMIAISALVDGGGLITGFVVGAFGRAAAPVVFPITYGIAALAVSLTAGHLLSVRGVDAHHIWRWPRAVGDTLAPAVSSMLVGIGLGLALGLFGCLYLETLRHLPWLAHLAQMPNAKSFGSPELRMSIFIFAVLLAPPAEEYLFRGLLYHALDREWGGWRAVAVSAAFFASYHPLMAWLPVGLLGATNAMLFRGTGRLVPAVLTHMVYNAVVLGWTFWTM